MPAPADPPFGDGPGELSEADRRARGWFVVAIVGLVILVLGVFTPTTRWIGLPVYDGTALGAVLVAMLGGIVGGLGLSKWYDWRPGGSARRRPPRRLDLGRASDLPSFEVYDGGAGGRNGNKKS